MSKSELKCVAIPALILCGVAFSAWSADSQPSNPAISNKHDRGVRIIQSDPHQGADNGAASALGLNPPENAAPIGPVAHSVLPVCDRPNSTADLVFRAQPEFDRNLSNALHSTRPVIVDVAEPYDQRSPPPAALEPWLSEVRSAGGAVTLSPYCASGGRGLGQGWFSDFVQHLTRSIYKPAKRYNVTLYADASRRRITQIAFRPRTAPMAVQN